MLPATSDRGAITAEFAIVLPTVFLLLAFSMSTLTAQFERIRLVSVAAGLARAVARGEPESQVRELYATQLRGSQVTFSTDGLLLCAEVGRDLTLLGLPNLPLRLADRECSRRLGL
jgi:Flp pilus assembly protein TadG